MTTVAELLRDGEEIGRGLGAELERVVRDDDRIGRRAFGLLRHQAAEALAAVLDIDLGTLALDGWAKYDKLRDAARRSTEPGAAPELVSLVEHQITSTHRPALEIFVDGVRFATIDLGLEVEIGVHGLDAELRRGRLTGLRTGDVDVRASLSVEGHTVVERERSYPVGALLQLGDGIPLTAAASAPPTRPRRVRLRAR